MKAQTIRVQQSDLHKLAELLCEMDYELLDHNTVNVVKALIENAHETVSNMLSRHESEIYKKDEKERLGNDNR